ncbi:unnamed protein product [Acanthoscelides obtectus]|uniref:PH domain-containing protein n=1 Tax=Acanthoscelides obtectus TaxID=200917 RepID=A0A9P0LH79_ACAOB|nr:unnamed protein product [Acanthoscelides obtectus]CAK1626982.1 Anillin [Acanthoscelides obtectus]
MCYANYLQSAYSQLSKSDEMYLQLKKIRDAECVKMNQASNALMTIKTQKDREWNKELVAEKILLECDIRNKLIVQKIRELKCPDDYSQVYKKRVPHKGSITVSNFEFDIKMSQDKPKKNTYTDFYVLALSYGTTLHMSNIAKVNENKLVFKDTFILKDLEDNFGIKAELFTLRLKTKKDSIRKICRNMFKKTTNNCCTNKIYYEDLNLNELLQSDILTPSFTHCLQFMLTKNQIDNGALFISPPPESKFRNYVNVNVAVNKLDLDTDLSGFLTWGTKRESIITWERKWVSLKGTQFSVYNYPQDEEYERDPCQSINLQYCLLPLVKEVENCPRKRTFVIKTGRPSTFVENEEEVALKKRYNFVLEKFYISADNNVDYKKWTETLESSLDTMRDWKQLVFIDDYYTK